MEGRAAADRGEVIRYVLIAPFLSPRGASYSTFSRQAPPTEGHDGKSHLSAVSR